jgi:hypothetical protein
VLIDVVRCASDGDRILSSTTCPLSSLPVGFPVTRRSAILIGASARHWPRHRDRPDEARPVIAAISIRTPVRFGIDRRAQTLRGLTSKSARPRRRYGRCSLRQCCQGALRQIPRHRSSPDWVMPKCSTSPRASSEVATADAKPRRASPS